MVQVRPVELVDRRVVILLNKDLFVHIVVPPAIFQLLFHLFVLSLQFSSGQVASYPGLNFSGCPIALFKSPLEHQTVMNQVGTLLLQIVLRFLDDLGGCFGWLDYYCLFSEFVECFDGFVGLFFAFRFTSILLCLYFVGTATP